MTERVIRVYRVDLHPEGAWYPNEPLDEGLVVGEGMLLVEDPDTGAVGPFEPWMVGFLRMGTATAKIPKRLREEYDQERNPMVLHDWLWEKIATAIESVIGARD